MVDYIGVGKAVLWFFAGVLFTAVGWYAIPPIIEIIPDTFQFARALGWFMVIMIAVATMAIIPIYHITKATKGV